MSDAGDRARTRRAELRRRSEETESRIARGLGEPALFAITLIAACSSLFYGLGVVAGDALGLTPVAYAVAGVAFAVTMLTYVEASSLHTERGGASMFARYAFDELWSFIAGWAILLDLIILMALGAFVVPAYMTAFWGGADSAGAEIAIAGGVLAWAAWDNITAVEASRYRIMLRIALVSLFVVAALTVAAFIEDFDIATISDSVDLGESPELEDLLIGMVVAGAAVTGIEAASGLAGELNVGRRGLKRVTVVVGGAVVVLFTLVSAAALMTLPVVDGNTALGDQYEDAPLLGFAEALDPDWFSDIAQYAVGAVGIAVLLVAVSGQLLGIGRLTYSLGTHRQIPSLVSRLHGQFGTPYVAILIASGLAFGLVFSRDVEFLAELFAFGATLAFALAHLSVIVLRFREPDRKRPYTIPWSVPVGRGSIPIPAAIGFVMSVVAWITVLVLHDSTRYVGGGWMAFGLLLYVIYRKQGGKSLRARFEIPAGALRDVHETEYGSILVPVTGARIDDDIIGTAGRLAAEEAEEGEGGPMIEALYVFVIPMSLPIDARLAPEKQDEAKSGALARAKEVGEEYEDVTVATAKTRGRTYGQAIVEEARRRGVEAIVLAAETPTKIRGGRKLGGRGLTPGRFADETTRYVLEKAPCRVILTAPAGDGDD